MDYNYSGYIYNIYFLYKFIVSLDRRTPLDVIRKGAWFNIL